MEPNERLEKNVWKIGNGFGNMTLKVWKFLGPVLNWIIIWQIKQLE